MKARTNVFLTITMCAAFFASSAEAQPRTAATFESLVAQAEQARQSGLTRDAIQFYRSAYQMKPDPTIAGRLGLLWEGALEDRANFLMEALEGNGGATEAEKIQFGDALRQVRPLVCVLRIHGNVPDAIISIDGDEIEGAFGYGTAFRVVEKPGNRKIRGVSKTAGEATTRAYCPAGGDADAYLMWPSTAPMTGPDVQQLETIIERAVHKAVQQEKCFSCEGLPYRHAIYSPSGLPRQEDPFADYQVDTEKPKEAKPSGISIAVAPVLIFGVATWQPAVGAMAGVRWRAREYLSLGIEGRGAWVTSGIKDRPISAMTMGGIASLCGHWRWLYSCALGHLGTFRLEADGATYKPTTEYFFRPGAGLRIGGQWTSAHGFFLGSSFDLLRVNEGTRVFSGQTMIGDQPPFMIGGQVLSGWEF